MAVVGFRRDAKEMDKNAQNVVLTSTNHPIAWQRSGPSHSHVTHSRRCTHVIESKRPSPDALDRETQSPCVRYVLGRHATERPGRACVDALIQKTTNNRKRCTATFLCQKDLVCDRCTDSFDFCAPTSRPGPFWRPERAKSLNDELP
jgi:hypothetical protein